MVAVAGREHGHAAAVEVHTAEVREVGILLPVHPAGSKPDLAASFVHVRHVLHDPRAFGDLILDLTRPRVVQPQVVPAVPLGHPDQFVIAQPAAKELVRIADEGIAPLVDDRPRRARRRVDGHDAQHLMPALVVDERESRAVPGPADVLDAPGIGEQLVADRDLPAAGHVEQLRPWMGDPVARLEVVVRAQFRLQLVFGRRLDDADLVLLGRLRAQGDQLLRVGRPPQIAHVVTVVGASVLAKRELRAVLRGPQVEAVVLEDGGPFSVGRCGAAPVLAAARPRVFRQRILFPCFHIAALDHGPGLFLRRLEHAQRVTGLVRHQPDVAGIRVLIVLSARRHRGVAAPPAVHVDPVDDNLARRLILERDASFGAGAPRRTWLATGRQRFRRRGVGTRTKFVRVQIQTPRLLAAAQHHGRGDVFEFQPLDWQPLRRHLAAQQLAEFHRRTGVIESRLARTRLGVHQDECTRAVLQFVAIPKPGLVRKPVRSDPVAVDARFACLSAARGRKKEQDGQQPAAEPGSRILFGTTAAASRHPRRLPSSH